MIEVVLNDRLGKKIRIKCKYVAWCMSVAHTDNTNTDNTTQHIPHIPHSEDDTIGDLKKLVAAQTGTRPDKIRIQKWYTVYKDHITLEDYEIHDGMGLELYYN